MPVILRDLSFTVTKTEQVLFLPTNYPRLFGGKIDLANLAANDIIRLIQETKYNSIDSFQLDRQRNFRLDVDDKSIRITPIREDDEIRWKIVLDASSPSATVDVKVVIWEETVV